MARPKSGTTLSIRDTDLVYEEKSCGYIMHQVKSVRCKMRWGELMLGKDETRMNWCQIALFKFELANPKLGTLAKKDLKHKVTFYFNEDNFCGLEKGQHITKHGTKRYICVILRDKHIIFQDAIIAMTNADHDVIQTWYKKITDAMRYMYRWKILGTPDARFLHVSKLNTSICLSLHNSNEGLKGKVIMQQQHRTKSIEKVEEQQGRLPDGSPCTHVELSISGQTEKVYLIIEPGKRLSDVINSINHTNQIGFDTLGYQNPNLVKIAPRPKKNVPKSIKVLSDEGGKSKTNNYISNINSPNKQNSLSELAQPPALQRPQYPGDLFNPVASGGNQMQARGFGNGMSHNSDSPREQRFDQTKFSPTNPFSNHHNGAPSRIPPRDPNMDEKKVSDTHVTLDSGFHTSDRPQFPSLDLTNATVPSEGFNGGANGPYVNLLGPSIPSDSSRPLRPTDVTQTPSELETNVAPAIPERGIPITAPSNHAMDLIEAALRNRSLPPIDANPDAGLPGYENSLSIEVTIDLVNRQNHENMDVSLGLPHSVYIAIVLGLEMNTVAGGDWRGLASTLGMSFEDVRQIEAATQNRQRLYPAHILFVHWSRAQAPYPFTRLSLKRLLAEGMSRMDLAELIPLEKHSNREGEGR